MLSAVPCFCGAEEVRVRLREVDGRVSVAFTAPGPAAIEGPAGPAATLQPVSLVSGTLPVPAASAEDMPQPSGCARLHPDVVIMSITL